MHNRGLAAKPKLRGERAVNETHKSIFLSYASQDAAIVERIAATLIGAGLLVWLDRDELRGGDAWDASIRRRIRECSLFLPIISANTESRPEGYFRREWNLAVDRMLDMAEDQVFLLPVVIDTTTESSARVPAKFRERQWTRLVAGELPPGFVEHVRHLLAPGAPSTPGIAATPRIAPPTAPAGRESRTSRRRAIGVALVLLVVSCAMAAFLRLRQPTADQHAPAVVGVKSIAVLPLENLSGRPEDAYLADGLHEEIINALSLISEFKVISRTSVMEYKNRPANVREIGQRLGVGAILEGSIRHDGNLLRLTVQLIDVQSDRHLLAANYDRDYAHTFTLQSAVAREVADALKATLGRQERGYLDRVGTNNGDAYDRYLHATALYHQYSDKDPPGLNDTHRLLEEALTFDPDYTDALAMLSEVDTELYDNSGRPADAQAARQRFERALAIDPGLPEAQLARGMYAIYVTRDYAQALSDLTSVVQQRPNSAAAHAWLGYALRKKSRFDEAILHLGRAWDLDPLNDSYAPGPIMTLTGLRRYPEVIEQTRLYDTRFPSRVDGYFARARVDSWLHQDPGPLRTAFREHGAALDDMLRGRFQEELASAEGRYLDAAHILENTPIAGDMTRAQRIATLYWVAGQNAEAEKRFRALRQTAQSVLVGAPRQLDALMALAVAQSLLQDHAAALATMETAQGRFPEATDPANGGFVSFVRAVLLARAGRTAEADAEVARLMHAPFGAPLTFVDEADPIVLLVKDDPRFSDLLKHPPRL